ncbi:MAG: hypothetical protein NC485_14765 [Ruminococcus flavefaciens]|nr:hypothetical protein [Ruminococcus flavefaciens]
MKNFRRKKKHTGHRIKGQNAPYENSEIKKYFDNLKDYTGDELPLNDVESLRGNFKFSVPQSVKESLKVNKKQKKVITPETQRIVEEHFGGHDDIRSRFISCMFDEYNSNVNNRNTGVDYKHCSFQSRDLNKSFQHVKKNAEVCYKTYLQKIKERLYELSKVNNIYESYYKKYDCIMEVVYFFIDIINGLYSPLPPKITVEVYEAAYQYDHTIETKYIKAENAQEYILVPNKKGKNLSQECVAVLIINNMH